MKITRLMTTLLTTAALLVLSPTLSINGGEQESLKVNKVTTVTYKGPHKVGDMTLQPGEYKVEHRANSSGEHYVHFTPKDGSSGFLVDVRPAPAPSCSFCGTGIDHCAL